jgi:hypothetical protein
VLSQKVRQNAPSDAPSELNPLPRQMNLS